MNSTHVIFRGILDLISDIFKELPAAKPVHSERMVDFAVWLAAMEKVGAKTLILTTNTVAGTFIVRCSRATL